MQGGVGDYTRELARAFIALGHQVSVLVPGSLTDAQRLAEPQPWQVLPRVTGWGWGCWGQVIRVLRQVRPDIVVTCDPTNFFPSDRYINHPDHRAAGQATLDAVFPASGSALFFPELLSEEGLQPHRIRQVYVAMPQTANAFIDVTGTLERKIAALREHRSQIPDPAGLEARIRERLLDPASPPEAPRYVERFRLIDLGR